jgi:ectoine hydroxylase-related dioxygenase (phytanoyl-CoA dioxygenase family)
MRFRSRFEEYERSIALELDRRPPREHRRFFTDTHTFLPWVYELASHPRVLDAAGSVLGPDLLVWSTQWFPKRPGDPSFVSWHQDGTYWTLDPPRVCTAWIAISRSDDANGCMRVVPGSHAGGQLPHRDTFAAANVLSRGQEIAVEVDESQARSLVLAPGEISLHHIGIVHGSRPNRSDEPRIGLAVRFVAPDVRQGTDTPHAMLVRGRDAFGHFQLLEPPLEVGDEAKLEQLRAEAFERLDRALAPLPPEPQT